VLARDARIGRDVAVKVLHPDRELDPRIIEYVSIGVVNLCAVMIARVYGPFILVPTILVTNTIVLQTPPKHRVRRYSAACGVVFMLIAIALEWTQLLPASYVFEGGTWQIVPQLVELPRIGTFAFMTVASVGMILVPAAFIARLRSDLTDAQLKLAVQAWHFRRLGAQLIGEGAFA
jgi:hypothetical protein